MTSRVLLRVLFKDYTKLLIWSSSIVIENVCFTTTSTADDCIMDVIFDRKIFYLWRPFTFIELGSKSKKKKRTLLTWRKIKVIDYLRHFILLFAAYKSRFSDKAHIVQLLSVFFCCCTMTLWISLWTIFTRPSDVIINDDYFILHAIIYIV